MLWLAGMAKNSLSISAKNGENIFARKSTSKTSAKKSSINTGMTLPSLAAWHLRGAGGASAHARNSSAAKKLGGENNGGK